MHYPHNARRNRCNNLAHDYIWVNTFDRRCRVGRGIGAVPRVGHMAPVTRGVRHPVLGVVGTFTRAIT